MLKKKNCKIFKLIGSGRTCFCYVGLIKKKKYAVKIYNKDYRKYIKKEYKIIRKLKHPNIIKVFSFNRICIFLELGLSLSYFTNQPIKKKKQWIKEIIQGIYYLHRNNIIHRDIKIDNIIVVKGTAKICDFAFSSKKILTYPKGTLVYLPPEAFIEEKVCKLGDIWALGVVYHYLMTGKFHIVANKKNYLNKIIYLNLDLYINNKFIKHIFVYKNLRKNIKYIKNFLMNQI